jgi:hypothetical protein
MSHTVTASDILDREFLNIRSRLIDLAAALDRIDRAEGSAIADPRVKTIQNALLLLAGDKSGRAEQVLRLFSLPYEENA